MTEKTNQLESQPAIDLPIEKRPKAEDMADRYQLRERNRERLARHDGVAVTPPTEELP